MYKVLTMTFWEMLGAGKKVQKTLDQQISEELRSLDTSLGFEGIIVEYNPHSLKEITLDSVPKEFLNLETILQTLKKSLESNQKNKYEYDYTTFPYTLYQLSPETDKTETPMIRHTLTATPRKKFYEISNSIIGNKPTANGLLYFEEYVSESVKKIKIKLTDKPFIEPTEDSKLTLNKFLKVLSDYVKEIKRPYINYV